MTNKLTIAQFELIWHGISMAQKVCHQQAVDGGWWTDLETDDILQRNKGELLMLMVSEIAECMEGVRKNLPDDKLPHRSMEEVELADTLIRIFDYADAYDLDLGRALLEKLDYNDEREDHKPENRRGKHGKKF